MIAGNLGVIGLAQAKAPVGQGFTVSPSDLSFILKQIKIAEHHAATLTPDNQCGTLVGDGPNQIPSPLVAYGLRTVDGSCNNLVRGQERHGAADELFPRLTTPVFQDAEDSNIPGIGPVGPPGQTSYKQVTGNVVDSEPRMISNLIVDQTVTNPAAVAAAGTPVRSLDGSEPSAVPCESPGVPEGCTPPGDTLSIPNVTTDFGLSPPFNGLFTIFGQFFDHGVDLTTKSGGTVFVPLKDDDPLIAGPDHIREDDPATPVDESADNLPANQRFMVLTRAQNQPGPDGIRGTSDDIHEATNTDSPWVDQSQTYTSHSSHQVFLREYTMDANNRPVDTGKLLGGEVTHDANGVAHPVPSTPGVDQGMATWESVKAQAADRLGLKLVDRDVLNIPMIAADPYGNFIPGPARGLPQYVTKSGLVEGNLANPVPVPDDAKYVTDCAVGKSCNEGFVVDIAHNAVPSPGLVPDADDTASHDFASQPAGTYDDELLNAHFCAGDGRVNENIALSAVHQVFHSEHDRLVDDITNTLNDNLDLKAAYEAVGPGTFTFGGRLFQAARFVTEMEYQHLVFEEFARKIQPAINPFEPFAFTQTDLNPAVKAEFAHAVYRFGHSMLTDTIARKNADGSPNNIPLLDGFLNPPAFFDGGSAGKLNPEQAAGSILMGMSDQTGQEIDEFVTDTLRNNLLGLPLDLPTINMTRAREAGIPPLNIVRKQIFAQTNDGQLKPYTSWIDFGLNMKHPESLVNFVAAYGTHPSITSETTIAGKRAAAKLIVDPAPGDVPPGDAADFMGHTGTWANQETGLNDVDLWVGGLAERTNFFGGLLGTTFNYVFENQLTDLQNGDRLYYLARTPGMNLRAQLEGNSFAELIMRNTDAHSLKADAFATADCKFELANLTSPAAAGSAITGPNSVNDDPASECDENQLLIRMPDGTIRYRERNTIDPPGINAQSVYNGTAGVDRIWGGNDSDTFLANEGNDIIEGYDGADVALGGEGNDIITDMNGDDNPKGGPGNDALDAGPGLDIVHGGNGKDFMNGGANANETFAGAGDDFAIAGQSLDAVFGDSGDDWEEGGDQPDLLQGDSGNLFFLDDSQANGHDILIGQGGDDDYDLEGGDDIGVGGPGIEKVAGASGYDWEIGQGDPDAQNQDLDLPLVGLDILTVDVRDKFNEVEALSGWDHNDILKGDDVFPDQVGGAGFIGCDVLDQDGVNRIQGLDTLLPPLTGDLAPVVAASANGFCMQRGPIWGEGNILLGGAGSDTLEGRGANDIIDGDRYLGLRLSVRDPNNPSTEIGSASIENLPGPQQPGQSAMTAQYLRDAEGNLTGPTLQEAVFAGDVDPGNIVAVREILTKSNSTDVDTAQFSDVQANYTITDSNGDPATADACAVVCTVSHDGGTGTDGVDTLRNIEKLAFSDTVAPGTPTIGTATATGSGQATVTFTPGTGVATGFSVRVVDAATGAPVGALRSIADGAASSVVVDGLTNGQAVRFQVQASNAFGTSSFSALSNAVTPTAPAVAQRPAAPAIGNATAGDASATVRWSPADNGGAAITRYQVEVLDAAGARVGALRAADADATSLVVNGLTNGDTYTFQVRATNSVGNGPFSAPSNEVTPATVPGRPVIRTAKPGDPGAPRTAIARWSPPDSDGGSRITGYVVTALEMGANGQVLSRTRSDELPRNQRTFEFTLPAGDYRFQVFALNAVGRGPNSARSNLVTAR